MLNVPLELCSAQEFNVLVKFWASVDHKTIGFSRVGLGDLYTSSAVNYIEKRNGKIIKNAKVKKIVFDENRIKYITVQKKDGNEKIKADVYVSALSPTELREVLPSKVLFTDFFRRLNAFEGVPYIGVNLWFDRKITRKKFWALLNDERTPKYMNTDFYDKSNIYETRKNKSFITTNIIYSKPYEHMSDKEIIDKTLEELREVFPNMDAKLIHSHVHRVPYGIYAPYPGTRKNKLSHKTPYTNFYVTGDWTVKEIPQCMEAAVIAGNKCSEILLKNNA